MKKPGILLAAGAQALSFAAQAVDFDGYATASSLVAQVDAKFVDPLTVVYPPGSNHHFRSDLGFLVFDPATFDVTNLLAAPAAFGAATVFPVFVSETNGGAGRERLWSAGTGVVWRTPPPPAYETTAAVTSVFGACPAWESLECYVADRDPWRQMVALTLVGTDNIAAVEAMLSQSWATGPAGGVSNVPWTSNDLAFVRVAVAAEGMTGYASIPVGISRVDLFGTDDPLAPPQGGWRLVGQQNRSGNPIAITAGGGTLAHLALGSMHDTDGDGLSDARELLLTGTSPADADSDLDGLTDGDEFLQYRTDPKRADSDLDWIGDAWEVINGCNPNDAAIAPPVTFTIDGGRFFVRSTNITLGFRGIVALGVEAGEIPGQLVPVGLTTNVPFTLGDDSNGIHTIHARFSRAGTASSVVVAASCLLDTIPPVLTVTSPTANAATAARWVKVAGTATDAIGPVTVRVQGEPVPQMAGAAFASAAVALEAGTNTVVITATDAAGHSVTQLLQVVQDVSGDHVAPALALRLPYDAGVTQTGAVTFAGHATNLALRGSCDDETAAVRAWVVGGDEVGQACAFSMGGTQLWLSATLSPGTNTLVLEAVDAAGNTGRLDRVIVCDTSRVFAITSDCQSAPGQTGLVVSGWADAGFTGAVLSVNGVACTTVASNGLLYFETVAAVPVTEPGMALELAAQRDGAVIARDVRNVEEYYEVRSWQGGSSYDSREEFTTCAYPDGASADYPGGGLGCANVNTWRAGATAGWTASNGLYWTAGGEGGYAFDCFFQWFWENNTNTWQDSFLTAVAPTNNMFGRLHLDRSLPSPCGYHTIRTDIGYTGRVEVVKRSPEDGRQTVVLQFLDFDYGRKPGDALDPSKVIYQGRPGFWFNGRVSFLVQLDLNRPFTIDESDFDWPEFAFAETEGEARDHWSGRWMSFSGVTNDEFSVFVADPSTNVAEKLRSSVPGSGREHIVTPRTEGSGSILLQARVRQPDGWILLSGVPITWSHEPVADATQPSVPAAAFTWTNSAARITTSAWGQHDVRCFVAGNEAWSGYVWIVWAEAENVAAAPALAVQTNFLGTDCLGTTVSIGSMDPASSDKIRMRFHVRPAGLWGASSEVPPLLSTPAQQAGGGMHWTKRDLKYGAVRRIDVTQRIKKSYVQTNGIPTDAIIHSLPNFDFYALVPTDYPGDPAIGNDDVTADNEFYSAGSPDPYLEQHDFLALTFRPDLGVAEEAVFQMDLEFQMFVRLNIARRWLVISDQASGQWSASYKLGFEGGVWRDRHCSYAGPAGEP